jgi:hypothetical protein
MTISDDFDDCYIKIFNSIKQYDYSIEQYTKILQTMISIRIVIHSLNNLNYGENISPEDERIIEDDCKHDFCRAYKGEEYC